MPRPKKERGRPLEKPYPPRIDATPEQLAQAFFSGPQDTLSRSMPDYRCAVCRREVHYPESLYNDGRCEGCHAA